MKGAARAAIEARSRLSTPSPDDAREAEAQRKAMQELQTNGQSTAQQEAAAREAARTETAWQAYFQRSPGCAIEANQTSVECVNEYIRARREFDRRWAAGEL